MAGRSRTTSGSATRAVICGTSRASRSSWPAGRLGKSCSVSYSWRRSNRGRRCSISAWATRRSSDASPTASAASAPGACTREKEDDAMTRVLVRSPHPDDESIGCGGTLRKHALRGDEVRVVFLTSGEKGGHGRPPEETARVREGEAVAAAAILGLSGVEFWRQQDGGLRVTPE